MDESTPTGQSTTDVRQSASSFRVSPQQISIPGNPQAPARRGDALPVPDGPSAPKASLPFRPPAHALFPHAWSEKSDLTTVSDFAFSSPASVPFPSPAACSSSTSSLPPTPNAAAQGANPPLPAVDETAMAPVQEGSGSSSGGARRSPSPVSLSSGAAEKATGAAAASRGDATGAHAGRMSPGLQQPPADGAPQALLSAAVPGAAPHAAASRGAAAAGAGRAIATTAVGVLLSSESPQQPPLALSPGATTGPADWSPLRPPTMAQLAAEESLILSPSSPPVVTPTGGTESLGMGVEADDDLAGAESPPEAFIGCGGASMARGLHGLHRGGHLFHRRASPPRLIPASATAAAATARFREGRDLGSPSSATSSPLNSRSGRSQVSFIPASTSLGGAPAPLASPRGGAARAPPEGSPFGASPAGQQGGSGRWSQYGARGPGGGAGGGVAGGSGGAAATAGGAGAAAGGAVFGGVLSGAVPLTRPRTAASYSPQSSDARHRSLAAVSSGSGGSFFRLGSGAGSGSGTLQPVDLGSPSTASSTPSGRPPPARPASGSSKAFERSRSLRSNDSGGELSPISGSSGTDVGDEKPALVHGRWLSRAVSSTEGRGMAHGGEMGRMSTASVSSSVGGPSLSRASSSVSTQGFISEATTTPGSSMMPPVPPGGGGATLVRSGSARKGLNIRQMMRRQLGRSSTEPVADMEGVVVPTSPGRQKEPPRGGKERQRVAGSASADASRKARVPRTATTEAGDMETPGSAARSRLGLLRGSRRDGTPGSSGLGFALPPKSPRDIFLDDVPASPSLSGTPVSSTGEGETPSPLGDGGRRDAAVSRKLSLQRRKRLGLRQRMAKGGLSVNTEMEMGLPPLAGGSVAGRTPRRQRSRRGFFGREKEESRPGSAGVQGKLVIAEPDRFDLLLLDEGEYYFKDYACEYHPQGGAQK